MRVTDKYNTLSIHIIYNRKYYLNYNIKMQCTTYFITNYYKLKKRIALEKYGVKYHWY